ncbi:HEAT repeat domain-containing protein [bacterium]|nr:HEAT repeat domain-containing protein [bacterium]
MNDWLVRMRDDRTRWDAMLALNVSSQPDVMALIHAVDDPDWMVRWCVADKLGSMGNPTAIPHLTRLLMDVDPNVRKMAIRSLIQFGPEVCGYLVTQLSHPHYAIRRYIRVIVLHFGAKSIPYLVRDITLRDWVSANQIVYLLYAIPDTQQETHLLSLLSCKDVQKTVVLMLGTMQSTAALLPLIRLYTVPGLRQPILAALTLIGLKVVVPFLVSGLEKGQATQRLLVETVLKDMGAPILPYLVSLLPDARAPMAKVVGILDAIGPMSVMPAITKLADKHPDIHRLTRGLRLKYPIKSDKGGDRGFFDLFSSS